MGRTGVVRDVKWGDRALRLGAGMAVRALRSLSAPDPVPGGFSVEAVSSPSHWQWS